MMGISMIGCGLISLTVGSAYFFFLSKSARIFLTKEKKNTTLPKIKLKAMSKDKGSKKDSAKKTAVKNLKEKRADKKLKQAEKRRKD